MWTVNCVVQTYMRLPVGTPAWLEVSSPVGGWEVLPCRPWSTEADELSVLLIWLNWGGMLG